MNIEYSQPMVSVIIPTFNRADLIQEAIESVMNQSYPSFEVIVVDDGSTDDTAAAVSRWGERITYIRRENNEGKSVAVNHGVDVARGDFIAVLDSDDVWLPQKLEAQMAVFNRYPECGAVGGGAMFMDLSGRPFGKAKIPSEIIEYERFAISMALPGSQSNEIVRREVFENVGGMDIELRRAQDYDFWLKVIRKYPIRAVPEVLMYKRAHQNQRPDADIDTIIRCRKIIAGRIPEPELRNRHLAWMWFQMTLRSLAMGRNPMGLVYLVRSFEAYPLRVSPRHKRLRVLLSNLRDRIFG